jgi:hypothetical protein
MRLVRVSIAPDAVDCPQFDPAALHDALWATVATDDLVEHIAIDAAPLRVHIGIFTSRGAAATAHALVRRLLDSWPPGRRWTVVETHAMPLDHLF